MLRLYSVVFLLMASSLLAAPAPVWRERVPSTTSYEVMLAHLQKTGKATGPCPTVEGTWTLTAEKIAGRSLVKPVLTLFGADGKVMAESSGKWGTVKPVANKKGAFTLSLDQVYLKPKGERIDQVIVELDLDLTGKR